MVMAAGGSESEIASWGSEPGIAAGGIVVGGIAEAGGLEPEIAVGAGGAEIAVEALGPGIAVGAGGPQIAVEGPEIAVGAGGHLIAWGIALGLVSDLSERLYSCLSAIYLPVGIAQVSNCEAGMNC